MRRFPIVSRPKIIAAASWQPSDDSGIIAEYISDDITVSSGTDIATWPPTANSDMQVGDLDILQNAPQLSSAATPQGQDALVATDDSIIDQLSWTGGPYDDFLVVQVWRQDDDDQDTAYSAGISRSSQHEFVIGAESSQWFARYFGIKSALFGTHDTDWHVWVMRYYKSGSEYHCDVYQDGSLVHSSGDISGSGATSFDPASTVLRIHGAYRDFRSEGACAYIAWTTDNSTDNVANYSDYLATTYITG